MYCVRELPLPPRTRRPRTITSGPSNLLLCLFPLPFLQDERTAAPVNLPAVRLVRSTVKIPVILNGDVNTPQEMVDFTRVTGTVRTHWF